MWKISSVDNTIDKKLKKFRSDKQIIDGYRRAILDLTEAKDPRTLGERKHGRYKYCYAYGITKSHRLVYRVFYDQNVVQLIDLDDHKVLFGRDDRS
ncbi:MAG: hypothetical protein ACREAG_02005 [Nitrosopumilaceae archaeon]